MSGYGRYVVQLKNDPEDSNSWEDCDGLSFEYQLENVRSIRLAHEAAAAVAAHLQYNSKIPHYVDHREGLED